MPTHQRKYPYAVRRVAAHFIPVAHLQRAPYSGSVEALAVTTADEVMIAATLLQRGRDRLVIICHGFGATQRAGSIVWLAEALAGPYDVLTFDWRGYGGSGGLASLGGAEALDLTAVLAAARARGYRRIVVVAESMGGLITLATLGSAAADPDFPMPDAIAAVSAPADYAFTAGPRPHLVRYAAAGSWMRPLAPLLGFRLGEVLLPRPLDVVDRITVPLLLVHGDRDNTVPVRNAYLLNERHPAATLRIYPGVDHAIVGMRDRSPQVFLQDLHELIGPL
jgi:pimeloyl-ACP methyl ester carboxylesterase